MFTYIIGAGGVGSWLVPSLAMLLGRQSKGIVIIDGDKLEPKNLNRQLFTQHDVGKPKAEALAERYGVKGMDTWFTEGMMEFSPGDVLLVCVDNHTARADALATADRHGCTAIFGANETYSAEAYVYHREWRDTNLDPRIYYPEITTDKSGDPRRAAIGCTGEAQENNPQLVTANFMAAALMQHLYITWVKDIRKFDRAAREHLPFKLTSNMTKLLSEKSGTPVPIVKGN